MEYINSPLAPQQILNDPMLNKGTGFSPKERDELGLHGFLPYHVATIQEQSQRLYANFSLQPDQISKYLFLSSLQNRNEVLFYHLISEHAAEMLPYIYTPTVGDVSLHFSTLYREPRGLYLSYPLKDKINQIIDQIPNNELDVIVVTDGERILGLGDLGVGGIAISVGKLSLYTVFGGIHPGRSLPVVLDVGTNNEELINNPFYLGWRHRRITGQDYDDFIDLFVKAIKRRFPRLLLQWEDFAKTHAHPLLDRYRESICSFNDDIQGTAAIVLAGVLSAIKATKGKMEDQRIVVAGGGNAGLGVCNQIVKAMVAYGIPEEKALRSFYIVDRFGLIHDELGEADESQKKFAQPLQNLKNWKIANRKKISLFEVVRGVKPTILIGLSAQPNLFTEEIVKAMAAGTDRPIIFPLSNPCNKAEADPADLIRWTEGKVIVATGSPFPSTVYKNIHWNIPQCNNVYIYPGVGLGVIATQAAQVSDEMFIEAARVVSEHSPMVLKGENLLFPPFEELRSISKEIGIAVARVAISQKQAQRAISGNLEDAISRFMWTPDY